MERHRHRAQSVGSEAQASTSSVSACSLRSLEVASSSGSDLLLAQRHLALRLSRGEEIVSHDIDTSWRSKASKVLLKVLIDAYIYMNRMHDSIYGAFNFCGLSL